jgi:hypothetical protein
MITFSHLGRYGRLGNQLFQYAALKGLSVKKGYEIKLPESIKNLYWHGQKCLLPKFNIQSEYVNSFPSLNSYSQPVNSNYYDEEFFNLNDNTNISGFFQNLKYFEFCESEVKNEFKISSDIQKKCDEYLENFKKPIVSIHVRRGDNIDYNQSDQYIIDSYIEKSIEYFNDDVYFLIFTGGSRSLNEDNREDVEYLKNTYIGEKVLYSETNDPIMDFCLMTKCSHNIISHDSTFSWWAAYLNENDNATIIAPRYRFSIDQTIEWNNFYPSNWILKE